MTIAEHYKIHGGKHSPGLPKHLMGVIKHIVNCVTLSYGPPWNPGPSEHAYCAYTTVHY